MVCGRKRTQKVDFEGSFVDFEQDNTEENYKNKTEYENQDAII